MYSILFKWTSDLPYNLNCKSQVESQVVRQTASLLTTYDWPYNLHFGLGLTLRFFSGTKSTGFCVELTVRLTTYSSPYDLRFALHLS